MDFISVAVLGVFLPQSPFSWLFQKPKEVSCWPCFILKTSLQKWINKSLKGSTGIEKAKKIYFYNNKEVKSLSWLDSNLSLFWHWFFLTIATIMWFFLLYCCSVLLKPSANNICCGYSLLPHLRGSCLGPEVTIYLRRKQYIEIFVRWKIQALWFWKVELASLGTSENKSQRLLTSLACFLSCRIWKARGWVTAMMTLSFGGHNSVGAVMQGNRGGGR